MTVLFAGILERAVMRWGVELISRTDGIMQLSPGCSRQAGGANPMKRRETSATCRTLLPLYGIATLDGLNAHCTAHAMSDPWSLIS